MAKKKNKPLYDIDPEGLRRLQSLDQDIYRETQIQASPYRSGGALQGVNTDYLSNDYLGKPISEDHITTEDAVEEHGSFLDAWNLFNKKQTNSDLTATRQDLMTIEDKEKELEFAGELVRTILRFKDLSDEYMKASDEDKPQILNEINECQNFITQGYDRIKNEGRYSDILRNLFYDTKKDVSDNSVLSDIIKRNTYLDRGYQLDEAAAEEQLKNAWKKNDFWGVSKGLIKYAVSGLEGIVGVAKNALVSAQRGIGMALPKSLGGYGDYNPFVDEAIRTSDIDDRRYDDFVIKGNEFAENKSKLNRFIDDLHYYKNQVADQKFEKQNDLSDLQDKYLNGSWYFNPKSIDPVYEKLQEHFDSGFLGIGNVVHSYYGFPELGSSFSDFKHFAELTATDIAISAATSDKVMEYLAKKATTMAVGGWYGKFLKLLAQGLTTAEAIQNIRMTAAAGETAANIYLTEQMRKNETKQEVFDGYNSRMIQDLRDAGIDINQIIAAGNKKYEELGLPIPTDPVEQFKNAILLDLDIDNPEYEKIVKRNKVGLNKVYNENQTLAAKDFIEGFAFMPYAGRAMRDAFYRSAGAAENSLVNNTLKYVESKKTSELLEQSIKNGTATAKDKAEYYVNKFIDKTLNKAFSNPATRVALTRPGRYIKNRAKQIMSVAPLEGLEEGQQNLLQTRYQAGEYDQYNRQQEDFDISSLFADQELGYEALAMYLGSYVGDPTEAELENRRAMNIGFTTSLWFGLPSAVSNLAKTNDDNIRNLIAQTKTDLTLRKYVAETYNRQEDDVKVGMLFDRYQKAGINARRVIDSLEQMKKYKSGFQGDLVIDKYIEDDQKLASATYNIYKSDITEKHRQDQNIKKGSDEHKMLVQQAVADIKDYENTFDKYQKNQQQIQVERDKILKDIREEISKSIQQDPNKRERFIVRNGSKYEEFLNKILDEYQQAKEHQNKLMREWNDPEKNTSLIRDAKKRILDRRKKELQKAGVEITDEVWDTEVRQADEFAQDEVRKWVFNEYSDEERKAGLSGMQRLTGGIEDYAESMIDMLIDAQLLKAHEQLLSKLNTKSEQMKFIHQELGSDINIDGIISFMDVIKNRHKRLKESAKEILKSKNDEIDRQNLIIGTINELAKRGGRTDLIKEERKRYKKFEDILNEYGEFGDITELFRQQLLSVVNGSLLQVLSPRVSVHTKGFADPTLLASSVRSRKWSELTDSQKEEYRKKVKEQAQKEGKKEPSEKSIVSKYNYEQQQKTKRIREIKRQYQKIQSEDKGDMESTLDELQEADLQALREDAANAYIAAKLNERIDNYKNRKRIYHLSYQDSITKAEDDSFQTQDIVSDNTVNTENTHQESPVSTEGDNTENTQTEADPNNPGNLSQMSPEMQQILGTVRQKETREEAEMSKFLGEGPRIDPTPKPVAKEQEAAAIKDDSDKNIPHVPQEEQKSEFPDTPQRDEQPINIADNTEDIVKSHSKDKTFLTDLEIEGLFAGWFDVLQNTDIDKGDARFVYAGSFEDVNNNGELRHLIFYVAYDDDGTHYIEWDIYNNAGVVNNDYGNIGLVQPEGYVNSEDDNAEPITGSLYAIIDESKPTELLMHDKSKDKRGIDNITERGETILIKPGVFVKPEHNENEGEEEGESAESTSNNEDESFESGSQEEGSVESNTYDDEPVESTSYQPEESVESTSYVQEVPVESINPDHDDNSYDGTTVDSQYDEYENSGRGRNKPEKHSDVQSEEEALADYLSTTFFYAVDPKRSNTPVTLSVNQTKLNTTYEIKPAKQLSQKLSSDRKWINTCDCYYVCSGNLDKKGHSNYDAITVSLVIDDHKEKATYVCFLKTPGKYKYGKSVNQYHDGQREIEDSLYMIGIKDDYIIYDESTNQKRINFAERNKLEEIAKRRAYELETGRIDPSSLDIPEDQKSVVNKKYEEDVQDWFINADQSVKDKVLDNAHRMMAKKGHRVLTSEEVREQITRLKVARNAIIAQYCDIKDNKITIPTTIKKTVRPKKSCISVSNGTFNNQTDEYGLSVYRNLNEVQHLGLSSNTEQITEAIENGTIEFGFGRGKWGNNPYAISSLTDPSHDFETHGEAGKSGSIYVMIQTEDGKKIPVMLSSQKFDDQERDNGSVFINRAGDTVDLCIDPKTGQINTVINNDGKTPVAVKPSLAEIILYMVCGKLNIQHLPNEDPRLNQIILDLIVNTGEHTVLDPDSRIQNDIPQLADKQISIIEVPQQDGTTKTKLALGRNRNGVRSIETYDVDKIFDPKDDTLRKDVIYTIRENLHWNTQVQGSGEKDRSSSMTDRFPILLQNFLQNYFEQNPEATEYKFCGLNKVSFRKEDLFEDNEGSLNPKKCNILSWMIVNGHIKTDMGDTVFKDPFVFATGIDDSSSQNTKKEIEQHTEASVPGGVSVVDINTQESVQSSRTDSEKIESLSKQKAYGRNALLNKSNIKEALTVTEEERQKYLSNTDGLFDRIALSVEFTPQQGKKALDVYKEAVQKSVTDYINFVNREEKLGSKIEMKDVDMTEITMPNFQNAQIKGYVPILQVYKNGKAKILFIHSGNILDHGKQITGVFSKVKEGKALTEQEARDFLAKTLGIEQRNVLMLNKIYDTLTNEEAYGMVDPIVDILTGQRTASIVLSRSNNFASTYHEAFHYASLLLNNRNERIALYKEFVNKYRKDLKHAKLMDIEEAMAESFREYMEYQTDNSILGRIKRFFKNIVDFINIFKKKDLVKSTYEALRKGGYKSKNIDQESLNELRRVYDKNKKHSLRIPGQPVENTQNFKEITDARTFYNVASSIANRFMSEYIILRPSDLSKLKGTPFNNFIEKLKEEAKAEQDPVRRNIINEVVENKAAFESAVMNAFNEYGVKIQFGKIKVDKDLQLETETPDTPASQKKGDDPQSAGSNDFTYDIENYQLSKKDNVAFRAKMFLGFVEKRKFVTDENGNRTTILDTDDILGYAQYLPFSECWNKILKDCWSCETFDELDPNSKDQDNPYAKTSFRYEIRFRSKSDEVYAALDEKMDQCYYFTEDGMMMPDIELQNQILSTVKSSFPKLGYSKIETSKAIQMRYDDTSTQSYGEDSDFSSKSLIPSDIEKDFTIFSDNTYKSKRMLPRQWSKQAISVGLAKYSTDKKGQVSMIIDETYAKGLLNKFKEVEDLLLKIGTGKNAKVERRSISNEEDAQFIYEQAIYKLADVMSYMGIPTDRHTLEYLMTSENLKSETSYVVKCSLLQDFVTRTSGSVGYFVHNVIEKNIGNPELQFRKVNDKGKESRKKKTVPIDQIFYGYNDDTFITKYAVAYSSVHPSSQDFSIQSTDNKKLYPIGDNNFITDTVRRGNYNIDKIIDRLSRCPYQKRSMLINVFKQINSMGSNVKDQISLMGFIGLKDADQNEGVDYFKMTRMEDFLSKMVLTFGQVEEKDGKKQLINRALTLPTMADKKTYYAIVGRLLDQLMCDDVITNTLSSENGIMQARRFSKATLSHFHNYFLDELDAIEQTYSKKNIRYLADNPGRLRKNYHGKRINIGTEQNPVWTISFGGNGGLFRYCYDFIIDKETGLNLNQMLEAKYKVQQKRMELEGKDDTRDEEYDGFELVREYIQELKQKYYKFNDEIAEGINNHLIKQIDDQLDMMDKSSNMKIIQKIVDENGIVQYKPRKIPRAIIQYYLDKISSQTGSQFKPKAYTFSSLNNEAAYCAIANHYVNTVISMIEYEKVFSGDQAQYKWQYMKDQNGKEILYDAKVDGYDIKIRKLRDKNTDRVKRLGAGLSPGKNIRTQYSQEILDQYPELAGSEYTNAYMNDLEAVSDYIESVEERFTIDSIAEWLRFNGKNNSNIVEKIIKDTKEQDIDKAIHGMYYYKKNGNKTYFEIIKNIINKELPDVINNINLEVSRQSYPYKNINVADAQVLIRPALYRKIRIGLGEWSFQEDASGYSDEKAYQILEKDDSWMTDAEKSRIVKHLQLYPLKMTYFDNNAETESPGLNVAVSRYNKMAIFPMFKYHATSKTGAQIYERMNRKGNELDMLTFDSAVKVGANQTQPNSIKKSGKLATSLDNIDESLLRNSDVSVKNGKVTTKKSISGIETLPVQVQSLSRLLKQLNTEAHTDEERAIGSQMFKIAFSDILENEFYGCDKEGNGGRSGKEIRTEIMSCINALTDRGVSYIRQHYLMDDTNARKAAQRRLIKDVIETNDLGNLALDIINGKGCVSSLSSRKVFEQSVSKKVNSKVVEIHTKGGTAVQQSIFGFVGYNKNALKSYSGNYSMFNEGSKLEWDKENGSMEIILSMNFFKAVVPDNYQGSYSQMRQWLIDHDIIKGTKKDGTKSNPNPFGVGYRIPTQGMSSMFAFTVADVLPEQSGDLIVVPTEFTAQTGSDFDVDKLFLATMSYTKDDENSTLDSSDVFDENIGKNLVRKTSQFRDPSVSEGAIQNRLLKNYIDIISDPKNFSLSRASIDVFTGIIQDEVLKELRSTKDQYLPGMYELSPMYQSERKMEFTTGKTGIGPFALNITNHALTQYIGLCMDYGDNIYNLGKLSDITGQDGRHILGWLSAMVNAHVDVAKDPYVFTLNVNSVTYNMTNFLIRAGKGKATFSFIAQPILKRYADQVNSEGGYYGNNDGSVDNQMSMKKKKERIQKQLLLQYYQDMIRQYNAQKSKLSEEKRAFWDQEISNIKIDKNGNITLGKLKTKTDVLNVDDQKVKLMLDCAKEKYQWYFKSSFYQILTMKAFQHITKYADEMSQLVMNSRIDTKKFGNNYADQLNFLNNYNQFKYNTSTSPADAVYWYINNPQETEKEHKERIKAIKENNDRSAVIKYFNDTFLNNKLQQAISLGKQILWGQSFSASDTFRDTFVNIMARLNGEEDIQSNTRGVSKKGYSKVYNKNTVSQVATAIENIFRAKCITGANRRQQKTTDYTGPIDFTFGGDKQETIRNIYNLLYGDPTAKPGSRDSLPLFQRIANLISYLKNPEFKTDEDVKQYKAVSYKLIDKDGNVINEFLNFLNPIPPSKNYPQGRLLLKENQFDRSSIRKDVLSASWNDMLTHPSEMVRRLAREIAVYSYYTTYDQNTRDSFFELVPPYYRIQYDESISNAIQSERGMKKMLNIISDIEASGQTVDEKYEYVMDSIARNYWYDQNIVPLKVESTNMRKQRYAWEMAGEMGMVTLRYSNISKRRINTHGIIITDNASGDYFTVKHDQDIFLYKKVGMLVKDTVTQTKTGKESTSTSKYGIYFIIPKLGRHSGSQHQYELINEFEDPSVYNENVLPTQFTYDNLMMTLENWINNPQRKYEGGRKDGNGNPIISINTSFKPINTVAIKGSYEVFNSIGDNYFNNDATVRFIMNKTPLQYVIKNSTFVLNFGNELKDITATNVINIPDTADSKYIYDAIIKYITEHNITLDSHIKIGQIGNKLNINVTQQEVDTFIKRNIEEYTKQLYSENTLSEEEIAQNVQQQLEYLNQNAKYEFTKRKATQVFGKVLQDLITDGYTVDTTYSNGLTVIDDGFVNASRILIDYIGYRMCYVVLPSSFNKVDKREDYETVVQKYDYEPQYVTNVVQENTEDSVADAMKAVVIPEKESKSVLPEKQKDSETEFNNGDNQNGQQDFESSKKDEGQVSVESTVIEDPAFILKQIGLNVGNIQDKIKEENPKPENANDKNQQNLKCE